MMGAADSIEAKYSDVEVAVHELDHTAWDQATAVLLTQYWSGKFAPTSRHAEARLIWTETALLARFNCMQQEPLVISETPDTSRKTMRLWDRDVCEVFLLPDQTRPEEYFEFEAAPTGEWLDLALRTTLEGRETDWDFQSGMTTASRVSEAGLSIALRIPWSNPLHKPKANEEWRANLCRCIGPADDRGYLAWRPTFTEIPNFHVTGVFGRLIFR